MFCKTMACISIPSTKALKGDNEVPGAETLVLFVPSRDNESLSIHHFFAKRH